MIYYDSKFKYNMENSWTNLKSLTLDFYLLKGSKNLLIQFLKGGYHQNLSRLRLLDLKFHPSLSKHLNGKQLLNLTRIELIDVVLKVFIFYFYYPSFFVIFDILITFFRLQAWSHYFHHCCPYLNYDAYGSSLHWKQKWSRTLIIYNIRMI